MKLPVNKLYVPLILFVFFGLSCSPGTPHLSGRYKGYNVILIISDALRPDYIGCYGSRKGATPNIDRLAKRSIIFRNAFCQIPLTICSTASIFTSLYPVSHNAYYIYKDSLPEKAYTMAEIFKIYGYDTAWFGSVEDPHTGMAKGMMRGFDHVGKDMNVIDKIIESESGSIKKNEVRFFGPLNWLGKRGNKPFMLTMHTYLTHDRMFPFLRYGDGFSDEKTYDWIAALRRSFVDESEGIQDIKRMPSEEIKKIFEDPESKAKFKIRIMDLFFERLQIELMGLNKKEFARYLTLLESAVNQLDKSFFAELADKLKEKGLDKNTIIVLTADHGNEYREHKGLSHGQALYDESIHVPLIICLPDLPGRKIVDSLAQSIDIMPTLLELVGIPAPFQAQGISLLAAAEGRGDPHNEFVYSELVGGAASIRSKRWKLIMYPQGRRRPNVLFDLSRDRRERHNIIDKRPDIAENLKMRLIQKRKSLAIYGEGGSEFYPWIEPETIEKIKKTGYW